MFVPCFASTLFPSNQGTIHPDTWFHLFNRKNKSALSTLWCLIVFVCLFHTYASTNISRKNTINFLQNDISHLIFDEDLAAVAFICLCSKNGCLESSAFFGAVYILFCTKGKCNISFCKDLTTQTAQINHFEIRRVHFVAL